MSTKNLMNKNLVLVGLGNPEDKYKNNRHNCGFLFLEWLDQFISRSYQQNKRLKAQIKVFKKENENLILAKPLTFMNNSGLAVKKILNFFKAKTKDLVVIHDDSDLFIGNFKIQFKRGSAGHKGVESIINALKSNDFYRVRIGVRPLNLKKAKAEEFVLKDFTKSEKETLKIVFEKIKKDLEEKFPLIKKINK